MVVSRKPCDNLAVNTLIRLNPTRVPFSIISRWSLISKSLHSVVDSAPLALWHVAPRKELVFKPVKECLYLLNLICFIYNIWWNDTETYGFSHLIVPEVCLLCIALNLVGKLLLRQHVPRYLPIQQFVKVFLDGLFLLVGHLFSDL